MGVDPREIKVSGNVVALLGLTKIVPHLSTTPALHHTSLVFV